MSETPHLLFERDGHVVTVTMNRPEARNAWSLEMIARMWDAWQAIDSDPEIRVAILTGAGGTFSAGADLKLMHSDQSANPWHARFRDDPELHWKAMLRSYRLKKPLFVPKGARMIGIASYDNSANNPANPDPKRTVRFGEQTWDEMMIGYMDVLDATEADRPPESAQK